MNNVVRVTPRKPPRVYIRNHPIQAGLRQQFEALTDAELVKVEDDIGILVQHEVLSPRLLQILSRIPELIEAVGAGECLDIRLASLKVA